MVTSTHETSHRIFPDHPEVLSPVFTALGLPTPRKAQIEAITPDVTELKPLERRVDTVLKVEPSEGQSFLIAIEAQTSRDDDKEVNWPYYVAYLRARFELPMLLVAVCRKPAAAAWAAGPFECRVGPWVTQVTRPFVLGPDSVPKITDEEMVTREPALATFSAIVHSESGSIDAILELLAHGMRSFDEDTVRYWSELLEVGLENTPARDKWKELEKMVATFFPGRGTLFEQSYLKGQAEAKAEGVLRVLGVRCLPVSDTIRERITTCTDLAALDTWLARAVTVGRVEDLFVTEQGDDVRQQSGRECGHPAREY